MAQRLAVAPEIAPVEAAAFAGVLEHRLAAADLGGRLPLPSAPLKTETRHVKPAPRLHLFLADARLKPNYSWYSRDGRHQGRFPCQRRRRCPPRIATEAMGLSGGADSNCACGAPSTGVSTSIWPKLSSIAGRKRGVKSEQRFGQ
jgi:hypothetical protein